mmetsp:Transcript_11887/g.17716  ORF Transcript_11887/g.17716 Transcript_11887/m.17716 type:complete len:422 (-) Transcript_11887:63-1328(-)
MRLATSKVVLLVLSGMLFGFFLPQIFLIRKSFETEDPEYRMFVPESHSKQKNSKLSAPDWIDEDKVRKGENRSQKRKGKHKKGKLAPVKDVTAVDELEVFTDCRKNQECKYKALIFTMDSLKSRVDESKMGGASGEMTIRFSLQQGLSFLGIEAIVFRSDKEFEAHASKMHEYSLIFLDPWTWAARGWVLKPFLRDHTKKIFLLDFFGSDGHKNLNDLVPLSHHLTAYPVNPTNTFLGYFIEQKEDKPLSLKKMDRGVVWGKDSKYYHNRKDMLLKMASKCEIVSTAPESALPKHPNITSIGHLKPEDWIELLETSKFLVGLGDPLVGPSAIDAISSGAMYINPTFKTPKLAYYKSQHPFAKTSVPESVCDFNIEGSSSELLACIDRALKSKLSPRVPKELMLPSYMKRLREILSFMKLQN